MSEIIRVKLDFEPTDGFEVAEWTVGDEVYETPAYMATNKVDGSPILMHWFNSQLRVFRNAPWANHLDLSVGADTVGVMLEPELFEAFRRNRFPELNWPIIDPPSIKYLGSIGCISLDDEIDKLFGDSSE